MTGSNLIDSSVWISYLMNGNYKEIIEQEGIIIISALSLFEIKKKFVRNNIPSEKISKSLEFIKKRSLVVSINEEIAEKAAGISVEYNLPAADSLIYSTSIINGSTLYTMDKDFRKLKGVVIL